MAESSSSSSTRQYTGDETKKTVLGDGITMKRMIDDAIIGVLLEDDSDFVEDVALSNFKLVVGFASVGASVVSHVYPAAFPKNWHVLLLCCLWYFIGSGILQLLLSFVELESIVLLRYKEKRDRRPYGLNVSTHFPRYQDVFTLGVTPLPSGSLGLVSAPKFKPEQPEEGEPLASDDHTQVHWSVAELFDERGVFYEEKCMDMARAFLRKYHSESDRLAGGSGEGKKVQ